MEELSKIPNFRIILYRDDGLGITRGTASQTEKLRQEIIKVFKKHGLKSQSSQGYPKSISLMLHWTLNMEFINPTRNQGTDHNT